MLIFNNAFAVILMLVIYACIVGIAMEAALSRHASRTTKLRDDVVWCDACPKGLHPDPDNHRRRTKRGTVVGLVLFATALGGSYWVSSWVDNPGEHEFGEPQASSEYILEAHTDVRPGVVQERLIGSLQDGTLVEATNTRYTSVITIKPDLTLTIDVGGTRDARGIPHNPYAMPSSKVRFYYDDGIAPGTFTTEFEFYPNADDDMYTPRQEYLTEACRLTVINLAIARHCQVTSSRFEPRPVAPEYVLDNLGRYMDKTVERVYVTLNPADYRQIIGAPTS